ALGLQDVELTATGRRPDAERLLVARSARGRLAGPRELRRRDLEHDGVHVVSRDAVDRLFPARRDVRQVEDAAEVDVEPVVTWSGEDASATREVLDEGGGKVVVVLAGLRLVHDGVRARTDVRRCHGGI